MSAAVCFRGVFASPALDASSREKATMQFGRRGTARTGWRAGSGQTAVFLSLAALTVTTIVIPAAASASSQFTSGEGTGKSWCATYGGTSLGSYKNVYACNPKTKKDGKTPFDSYPGFQCTELANRYLYLMTKHTLFDNEEGGNFVALAATAFSISDAKSGTAGRVPAAGDIISMWGGRSDQKENGGRTEVALVTKVAATASGWTITTLNQGDPSDTDGRDGLNTITVSANGRTWSTEDGFYATFEWLKLPRVATSGAPGSGSGTGTGSGSSSGSWTAAEAPLRDGEVTGQLQAVACSAAINCTAAGSSGGAAMLVYSSGNGWKAAVVPAPATGAKGMELTAVACPSATSCVAAGQYHSQSRQQGVLLAGHGATWTATRSPLPSTAASHPHVVFSSMACPTATACVAVGAYTAAAGTSEGLIVTGHDTSWTAYEAPLPSDARAKPSARLTAVACSGAGHCAAVGSYYDKAGNEQGLIVTGTGSSWSGHRAVLPSSAVIPGASLSAVACPAASDCVAAGSFSANQRGMVLTGSGSSWKAVATPLPAGSAAKPGATLQQIVCPSATECVAAGSYKAGTGGDQGLLIGGHGTKWTAVKAPLPSGAAADQSSPGASLVSVACAAANSCVAAGQYTDTAGDAKVLLLYWRGSSWAASSGPLPANNRTVGAQAQGSLGPPAAASLSCPSAGTCFVVGTYPAVRTGMEGLVEYGKM
jgi:hypothetical protein